MSDTLLFDTGWTWLGYTTIAMHDGRIRCIALGDNQSDAARGMQHFVRAQSPDCRLVESNLDRVFADVRQYFQTPTIDFAVPLDIRGTDFQRLVWTALKQIPIGETTSYTQIAHVIGCPKAMRAVARACATNPIAVVIPCHRVMRVDGSSAGYRWGAGRKDKILRCEQQAMKRLWGQD